LFVTSADALTDALPSDPSQGRPEDCPGEERTERHLRLLRELADIGMEMARAVRAQAVTQAAERDVNAAAPVAAARFAGADLGLVFSRIARAVRQTLALEARLAEEGLKARAEHAARRAGEARARAAQRKREVRNCVSDAIQVDAPPGDVEALLDELDERLGDPDYAGDFADRPIGELIASICRDLGITPDWGLWEDEDWAIEAAAARPPGSPYTAPPMGEDDAVAAPPPDPPWPTHHPPDKLS
jgi:hypothetical protein